MDDPYTKAEPPEFDEDQAQLVIGKQVLVGVTYCSREDEVLKLEQFHGTIVRASRKEGVIVQLSDGTERWLPPDLSKLEPACPGNYRLKSTGKTIVDPDYLSMWTVYPQKSL